MRIQHNIPAMNAYRNYNTNVKSLQGNLQKLSSGYKINKAGDDAAGLAISEKMRAQISGLEVAQKNAKDGISLVQTAEGAMTEIHTMLNRMFSLAEQSANGTYDDDVDREQLQNEFHKLTSEIDRIAKATNFNGKKLLNGDLDGPEEVAETKVTSVKATLDQGNAAKIDSVKIEADGADDAAKSANLQKINEALDGKEIKIKFENDGTPGIGGAGDKITLTGLPEGVKLQYTNGATPGAAEDVVDGTAIEIGTTAGKMAALTGNTATFDIVDDAGTKLGTIAVEFDGTMGASSNGETTVSLAGSTAFEATKATATPAAGGTATVNPTFTFADDVSNEDIVALNKILGGKTLTVATKADVAGNATDWDNNDTVTLGGTAWSDLKDNYTITYTSASATTPTALDTTNPEKLKMGGTAGAGIISSNDTAISFSIAKADGTKVATLDITLPAAGAATVGTDTLNFSNDGTTELPVEEEGTKGEALRLRVGDSVETYDDIKVAIKSLQKDDLKTDLTNIKLDTKKSADLLANAKNTTVTNGKVALSGLSVLTDGDADVAMVAIKDMINQVSTERGNLGATQNRLDHTINNLSTMQENIQDAESTIRDVDVAEEMMKYTKNNILVQSAQAMLAQANQLPQGVLQLLG